MEAESRPKIDWKPDSKADSDVRSAVRVFPLFLRH